MIWTPFKGTRIYSDFGALGNPPTPRINYMFFGETLHSTRPGVVTACPCGGECRIDIQHIRDGLRVHGEPICLLAETCKPLALTLQPYHSLTPSADESGFYHLFPQSCGRSLNCRRLSRTRTPARWHLRAGKVRSYKVDIRRS